MQALGVDIGGSGVKGAIVDLARGELVSERIRYDTPTESKPAAVAQLVANIVRDLDWKGPLGCTYPGVIHHGVVKTAANLDKSWINVDGVRLLEMTTGRPVRLLNDADAAGIAEMEIGAGRGERGVVILLTFGTGIGSAIFLDGKLLPNTEFGHLQIRGKDAEHRAAARIRKEENLTWEEWAARVNEYLAQMEFFFSPDLFIIGGGVSKKYDKFLHLLRTRARVTPAQLLNEAGIIGAAMSVRDLATRDGGGPIQVPYGPLHAARVEATVQAEQALPLMPPVEIGEPPADTEEDSDVGG